MRLLRPNMAVFVPCDCKLQRAYSFKSPFHRSLAGALTYLFTKLLADFLNYSLNHLLAYFLSYLLSPLTSYLPFLASQAMGIPLNNLICASNENNILTEFFRAGSYNMSSRRLKQTISPSIDILKSSNLERLLYHATESDGAAVAHWMASLEQDKYFKVKLTTGKVASKRCDLRSRARAPPKCEVFIDVGLA